MEQIRISIVNGTPYLLRYNEPKSKFYRGKFFSSDSTDFKPKTNTKSGDTVTFTVVESSGTGPYGCLHFDMIDDVGKAVAAVRCVFRYSLEKDNMRLFRFMPVGEETVFYGNYNLTFPIYNSTDAQKKEPDQPDHTVRMILGEAVYPSKFIVVSDVHFGNIESGTPKFGPEMTQAILDRTNSTENIYSEAGYGARPEYLGVIVCGDNYNRADSKEDYGSRFRQHYFERPSTRFYESMSSDHCLMNMQTYEGIGNHDGSSAFDYTKRRNLANTSEQDFIGRRWMLGYSSKSNTKNVHYHWIWKGIYFFMLYSATNNNPYSSGEDPYYTSSLYGLTYLKDTLSTLEAKGTINKNTPIVVCCHPPKFSDLKPTLAEYNIILAISGHYHLSAEAAASTRIRNSDGIRYFDAASGMQGKATKDKENWTSFFEMEIRKTPVSVKNHPEETIEIEEIVLVGYGTRDGFISLEKPLVLSHDRRIMDSEY